MVDRSTQWAVDLFSQCIHAYYLCMDTVHKFYRMNVLVRGQPWVLVLMVPIVTSGWDRVHSASGDCLVSVFHFPVGVLGLQTLHGSGFYMGLGRNWTQKGHYASSYQHPYPLGHFPSSGFSSSEGNGMILFFSRKPPDRNNMTFWAV